jgi:hypothetical protein
MRNAIISLLGGGVNDCALVQTRSGGQATGSVLVDEAEDGPCTEHASAAVDTFASL